jgi:RecA/RadA recombinase
MSFNLMDSVNADFDKKDIGSEITNFTSFSTGIDLLDFMNGMKDNSSGITYAGFPNGRMVMIIGKSGSGKSALAVQIAEAITSPYPNAMVNLNDFERATRWPRLSALTGVSEPELRKRWKLINDSNLTTEAVTAQVSSISALKLDNADQLMVEVPHVIDEGHEEILTPTVLLIDSQAMMTSKDVANKDDEEFAGNNMSGGKQAGRNSMMYSQINIHMLEANIIPIVVNHITKKIQTGFMPAPADINFLKVDENLKGGNAALYLTDTLIRVKTSTKLTEDKEYGIRGFVVEITLVKSRSNTAGIPFEVVYDQASGFDNDLTNLRFLKKMGHLKGSPRAFYFEGAPKETFTQKTFKEKLYQSEALQEAMGDLLGEELPKLLSVGRLTEDSLVDRPPEEETPKSSKPKRAKRK